VTKKQRSTSWRVAAIRGKPKIQVTEPPFGTENRAATPRVGTAHVIAASSLVAIAKHRMQILALRGCPRVKFTGMQCDIHGKFERIGIGLRGVDSMKAGKSDRHYMETIVVDLEQA
jgi:hypothetical protein